MDKILEAQPENVKLVSVWSDGPASQFKNLYVAAAIPVLEKKHAVKVEWNFFCTSHGKGPVDGIGGSVKRYVWKNVRSRKTILTDAASFVAATSGMQNVTVTELSPTEIQERNKALHLKLTIFIDAVPIRGIAKHHFVKIVHGKAKCFTLTKDGTITGEVHKNNSGVHATK